MTFDPGWDPVSHQNQVLGPLVRVIEEAASDAPWELILAVCLGAQDRIHALRTRMLTAGYDTRLVVRLLREGRVEQATEEAVWAVLERPEDDG